MSLAIIFQGVETIHVVSMYEKLFDKLRFHPATPPPDTHMYLRS